METLQGTIGVRDVANQVAALSAQKDAEIQALLDRIDQMTVALVQDLRNDQKYQILVAAEYLFVRCRIIVEQEAVKCKQLLNDVNTPPVLKTFFTKRSVVMAEISAKLTLIRDDIGNLSRMQYNLNWQQKD